MQTHPPVVDAFGARTRGAAPSPDDPDLGSPTRYILWLLGRQKDLIAVGTFFGLFWFLPSTISPWLLGKAIDQGILRHDLTATLLWAGLMFVSVSLGVIGGVLMHTTNVTSWLVAKYSIVLQIARKMAQMGHVSPRRTPAGEMLSVASSDTDTYGALVEVVGRAIAALVAFLFVSYLVLRQSVELGLLTLVAGPILVGAGAPLLKPLQRAQAVQRGRSSELTGMATDIVAGLRILRGVGGEQTFGDNYARQSQRVRQSGIVTGAWQAVVESIGVLLSGLLLVALTWLGAHELLEGRLTIGQLISFFGYAMFISWPIYNFYELAQKWVQGLVAAKKSIAVLGQQPPWNAPENPRQLPHGAPVVDERSGLVVEPGQLTVLVSATPDETAAQADRLGRYLPSLTEAVSLEIAEGLKGKAARAARAEKKALAAKLAAEDEELAAARWQVTVGGVDLADATLDDLRRTILVQDTASACFAGTLQELLDPHGRATRQQAEQALVAASAEDVYEALPGGWQGVVEERGRGFSGGQRQRLVLARSLLADPEVLVLVEPTSAVDAHTEARIAERVADLRRGRTTVVTTVSPLWLHWADRVVLMAEGAVVAAGTHEELMDRPDYRAVVARGTEMEDPR